MKQRKVKVQNILVDNEQTCDMHNCLSRLMTFLRWAGLFPVVGLRTPTVQSLRFELKSFYGIYYFTSFFGQASLTTLSAIWCFTPENYSSSSVTNLIFCATALLVMIILLRLAKCWPILLKRVAKIEFQLRDIRRDNNVKKHCDYLLWFVAFICFVEHALSLTFFYKTLWDCYLVQRFSPDFFEYFCIHIAPYLFGYTNFALWKIVIFELMHFQTVMLWGVTDVLPMCASLYLLSYFRDLNTAINTRANKDTTFWGRHRMHYTRLENLVSLIDEQFNSIVLFSFFNYLYFISMQLFYLLNSSHTLSYDRCNNNSSTKYTERVMFYLFSVSCLITRALTMSLLAANVHIEAQKPLLTLHDISKEEENKEIQRFRLQLVYNPVSMTGCFVSLTRNSILKFISTIITYELVLLQINRNRKSDLFRLDTLSIQNITQHL